MFRSVLVLKKNKKKLTLHVIVAAFVFCWDGCADKKESVNWFFAAWRKLRRECML